MFSSSYIILIVVIDILYIHYCALLYYTVCTAGA